MQSTCEISKTEIKSHPGSKLSLLLCFYANPYTVEMTEYKLLVACYNGELVKVQELLYLKSGVQQTLEIVGGGRARPSSTTLATMASLT